jgi:ABC-type multidrug transport system fused ATPase/permease subunit
MTGIFSTEVLVALITGFTSILGIILQNHFSNKREIRAARRRLEEQSDKLRRLEAGGADTRAGDAGYDHDQIERLLAELKTSNATEIQEKTSTFRFSKWFFRSLFFAALCVGVIYVYDQNIINRRSVSEGTYLSVVYALGGIGAFCALMAVLSVLVGIYRKMTGSSRR